MNTSASRDDLIKIMRRIISQDYTEDKIGPLCEIVSNNVPHPDWSDLFYYPPHGDSLRTPEEIVDLALAYKPVEVNVPLLNRLKELEQQAIDTFHFEPNRCFDHIGFARFPEIRKSGYWCSPQNSAEFVSTGGDGHHFSFLLENNAANEQSPIIFTRPDYYDQANMIVGENLYDFLCFGMHCGYFHLLGVLDYPDDRTGHWFGEETREEQRFLLGFLTRELNLKPWENRHQRLAELQERYMPLLQLPPEE